MMNHEALTERELEILRLIADGLSNQAIADRLYLTLGTVKWYNKQIYAKLDVTSRTQAVVQARKRGLLTEKTASHNLPAQTTAFIGRENEITGIKKQLLNPSCRLLTLFGPGGIGKTRLAVQIAWQCLEMFDEGVYFCPLQGVADLVTAIADAVGLTISGQFDPKIQLLRYLRDRSVLLVIDNIEHLLDSSSVLSDLLEAAPHVKLLVTSRERLNLHSEWLYYVHGLAFPRDGQDAASYPAVELFVVRARQVIPSFTLEPVLDHVIRICQFVEGMPLAIELAASWLRVADCAEIIQRIQTSLDFLKTHHRDVPARHRSMRAVFDASWQLLSVEQQNVFQRLSVFQGGFSLHAAQVVAGASLALLAGLMDKALLYRNPDGRFNMHELLRQYARDHQPDDWRIGEAHSAYYADFLNNLYPGVITGHQLQAKAQINSEIHNIRSAWGWAVENKRADLIRKSVFPLFQYFRFNSLYLEADETFRMAAEALAGLPVAESSQALAELLCYRGWTLVRSGDSEAAQVLFQQSLAIYDTLDTAPIPGSATDPLTGFGIIACVRGEYNAALSIGERALAINEARGDPWNQAQANYILASATFAQGDFAHARIYAQRAHDLLDGCHERWMITYMKNFLGNIARIRGDFDEAMRYFQDSFNLYQAMGDREGLARTLNQMGQLACLQQDYRQAQEMHLLSYRSYLELGDQGGLATALCGLGAAAGALGEPDAAHSYLQQALEIAQSIQYMPLVCSILVSLGEILIALGQPEMGISLLGFADHHTACQEESRGRVRIILDRLPSPALVELHYNRGRQMDYETVIRRIKNRP